MAAKYVKGKIYRLALVTLQCDPRRLQKFMDLNDRAERRWPLGKGGVTTTATNQNHTGEIAEI